MFCEGRGQGGGGGQAHARAQPGVWLVPSVIYLGKLPQDVGRRWGCSANAAVPGLREHAHPAGSMQCHALRVLAVNGKCCTPARQPLWHTL